MSAVPASVVPDRRQTSVRSAWSTLARAPGSTCISIGSTTRMRPEQSVGPASAVELVCELRGDLQPSVTSMPIVAGRLGVDQFPIDLSRRRGPELVACVRVARADGTVSSPRCSDRNRDIDAN